jgi:pantetheine-phosphate adenylyltransferase
MKTAIYPGSFDPITVGHLDIIKRISKLYDKVTVLISHSQQKSYLFSAAERKQITEECLKNLPNVSVEVYQGLTVDFMRSRNIPVIIRGLRAVVDFEYEMAMANMNRKLAPDIETILMFASPEHYYISSRAIKEIARFAGKLDDLVPDIVKPLLVQKMKEHQ